ncbi:MAG: hypothetical protein BWY32_03399 [bacterium ADurb.Bin243]|nr:MAG: hypothetical protein BWY32_03399 [bacterium ADurb.Bin243]
MAPPTLMALLISILGEEGMGAAAPEGAADIVGGGTKLDITDSESISLESDSSSYPLQSRQLDIWAEASRKESPTAESRGSFALFDATRLSNISSIPCVLTPLPLSLSAAWIFIFCLELGAAVSGAFMPISIRDGVNSIAQAS